MTTQETIQHERWKLEEVKRAGDTYYSLSRNALFRAGIFDFATTLDFVYKADAEKALALLKNLELMAEANILETVVESLESRKQVLAFQPKTP